MNTRWLGARARVSSGASGDNEPVSCVRRCGAYGRMLHGHKSGLTPHTLVCRPFQGRVADGRSDHNTTALESKPDDHQSRREMALLDGLPRSASVTAIEESQVLIISRKDFLECIQKVPQSSGTWGALRLNAEGYISPTCID